MEALVQIATNAFGLRVERHLPVSESFSSNVLLFLASDGNRYVVKRPYAANKARREIAALRALADHPRVPMLIDTATVDHATHLLIEGVEGTPWSDVGAASPGLLRSLGSAMRELHDVRVDDFHGYGSWHEFLIRQADTYLAAIGDPDRADAQLGRRTLESMLEHVPDSGTPRLVHFDLRPGNVLVHEGELAAIIDFEGSRGGHPSMDFFKLWEVVAPMVDGGLDEIVTGYVNADPGSTEEWMSSEPLDDLMTIYATYHGLAGLAWCHQRDVFDTGFAATNRGRLRLGVNRNLT